MVHSIFNAFWVFFFFQRLHICVSCLLGCRFNYLHFSFIVIWILDSWAQYFRVLDLACFFFFKLHIFQLQSQGSRFQGSIYSLGFFAVFQILDFFFLSTFFIRCDLEFQVLELYFFQGSIFSMFFFFFAKRAHLSVVFQGSRCQGSVCQSFRFSMFFQVHIFQLRCFRLQILGFRFSMLFQTVHSFQLQSSAFKVQSSRINIFCNSVHFSVAVFYSFTLQGSRFNMGFSECKFRS